MKLQSQATQRFDRRELQRLARASRPYPRFVPRPLGPVHWAFSGLMLGAALVGLYRLLWS